MPLQIGCTNMKWYRKRSLSLLLVNLSWGALGCAGFVTPEGETDSPVRPEDNDIGDDGSGADPATDDGRSPTGGEATGTPVAPGAVVSPDATSAPAGSGPSNMPPVTPEDPEA